MFDQEIDTLTAELERYRAAVAGIPGPDHDDLTRLTRVVQALVTCLRAGEPTGARLFMLGFARQAADAHVRDLPEFIALTEHIGRLKRRLSAG